MKLQIAYGILAGVALFIIGFFAFITYKDPEIMLWFWGFFLAAAVVMWALLTVMEWEE